MARKSPQCTHTEQIDTIVCRTNVNVCDYFVVSLISLNLTDSSPICAFKYIGAVLTDNTLGINLKPEGVSQCRLKVLDDDIQMAGSESHNNSWARPERNVSERGSVIHRFQLRGGRVKWEGF